MTTDVSAPLLSVRLMTYNHEPYIAQAIESCLSQVTDFQFEIVIGDDFSTDNTLEICKKYENEYPNIIRVLERNKGDVYHKKRQKLGRLYNFTNILKNCRGKYISLIDGDDYWVDNLKLKKQVDFLESNNDYAFSFHNTYVLNANKLKERITFDIPESLEQEDLISFDTTNIVPSASIVYKSEFLPEIPQWFYTQSFGDWPLILLLLENDKKANYISTPMSVYRNQGQGLWAGASDLSLLLKKRNFINNIKTTELSLKKSKINEVLKLYDAKIDSIIETLENENYRNMNISKTISYLLYRVGHALKNLFL